MKLFGWLTHFNDYYIFIAFSNERRNCDEFEEKTDKMCPTIVLLRFTFRRSSKEDEEEEEEGVFNSPL